MDIAIMGDQNYILGIAALLKSLDLNVTEDPNQEVKINIISTGINTQQKERLQNCCKFPIEWREFQINRDGLLSWDGSMMTYARLEPEKYTSAKERLMWIDSDTIVLGSLDPLWNIDLEGMPIGAVPDPWGNPENPDDPNLYLNAGVLVYDIKLWIEEGLSQKILENARANLWSDCDQGATNAVLAGRWKQLDGMWNSCVTDDPSVKVLHFISRPKPWQSPTPNKLWLEMLSQTPFKDDLQPIVIKSEAPWLSKLKGQYKRWQPWLKDPVMKLKSYLKKRQR